MSLSELREAGKRELEEAIRIRLVKDSVAYHGFLAMLKERDALLDVAEAARDFDREREKDETWTDAEQRLDAALARLNEGSP